MGHIRAKQNQIAGAVIRDAIAHQSLAAAFEDEGQLVLWMVVPVEGERGIVPRKCNERRWTRGDLLENTAS